MIWHNLEPNRVYSSKAEASTTRLSELHKPNMLRIAATQPLCCPFVCLLLFGWPDREAKQFIWKRLNQQSIKLVHYKQPCFNQASKTIRTNLPVVWYFLYCSPCNWANFSETTNTGRCMSICLLFPMSSLIKVKENVPRLEIWTPFLKRIWSSINSDTEFQILATSDS